ncbi:conjugal transfer protein TraG N-terminal domain-containing protein [Burkholderia ubonensis]|uniref:conjugal transfer protein TraG N-terminal domain-containing protein n=1 Tax=Burkholderia ubonensis TaxID=101571 RepID=UPI0018DF7B29|nr:conjugal transfer protein TraG N-terminal domain-containing protein [Burkholderia ubonensis]
MNGSLSRAARMLLGFAALMGAAGSASAAGNTINLGSNNVWTVYAFGNAQAVADAFRALTNFAASGTFQSIVGLIAVLGVLGVGLSGGFNPAMAKRFIGYVVGVFIVCYVFFGVTNNGPLVVNVEVIDTVDMTWKAPVTVPAVVGIPASVISTAGYRITEAIEASFSIPTELKMSKGAPFNLAAAMLADASTARIMDPNLASSLAYYVQDCFTIGVAKGALQASTLLTSTNFLEDIKFTSNTVYVNTLLQPPAGTPGVVTCTVAWDLINTAVNAQGGMSADFLKDASAWSKTPAMTVVNAAADSMAQWATNSGITDGAALVKQSAVLSAFRGAYAQASAQTGNSDFLTGIAMTQATESQRTSWITGAEIFNKTMGYIFAIIQVFVYAITPLVLCAALVPGLGLALLKNFSQILLWLAIWQPMLAIVNFIVLSMQQADLGGILSNGAAGYGFTLTNMGIVSEKTANLRAAASFVGTMVPALAWAMVKGSVDFSRVIGSAVGENFAQGAANTMTTGNYSLNQASMDSFTANKHSTAATGAWGEGHTNASTVGSRSMDLGGSGNVEVGKQQLNVGVGAGMNTQDAGSRGDGAQVGRTGSNINSGTTAAGTTTGTSSVDSGGNTQSSALIHSLSGQGGVSGGAAVIKPGSNGPANNGLTVTGTNVPATPGVAPGAAPGAANQVAQLGNKPGPLGKAADRLRADVSASMTAGLTGQQSDVSNHSHVDSKTQSSTLTHTGSNAKSGGETGSTNKNASENHGWSESQNMQITGISPTVARVQAKTAFMLRHNTDSDFLTGDLGYAQARSSRIGDKVAHLNTPGAIEKDVQTEQHKVAEQKGALTDRVKKLENDANAAKGKFEGAANGEQAKGEQAVKDSKAPAEAAASGRFFAGLKDVGAGLFDDAKETVKDLEKKGENLLSKGQGEGGQHKPGAADKGAHAPTQAATPAQGNSPSDTQAPKQGVTAATAAQAPAGQQHGDHGQPKPAAADKGIHAPTQAPAGQQHGDRGQPTAVAADKGAHAPTQAPAGQQQGDRGQPTAVAANKGAHAPTQAPAAPQQGDHGQPKPVAADKGAHAPTQTQNGQKQGDHGQPTQVAATDPRQQQQGDPRQQEQQDREREMQQRQLAAAASVAQALAAAQPPQAQANQPLPTPAEAPTQLAQAPQPQQHQPDTQGQQAVPNPFSGEKVADASSQLQGQVQMAEQRAERLDNQRRAVDGVLASAEGRKANELPELINQARDITRNA